MSNCIFAWPDYTQPTPLYTPDFDASGDWETDLPLTNLIDRRLHKVARSASAAIADTRLRADLKADRQVRVVAIPKHTISSAGYVRVLGVPSSMLFDYEAGDDIAARGGTFARADATTCATYVDRNGVVRTVAANIPRDGHFISSARTALLALSRANICLRSQEFDNATWAKTRSSISANAETAPDGTLTADRLIEDGTAASTHVAVQAITVTADASIAFSCFVKAGTRTWVTLTMTDAATGGANANFQRSFNLTTGAVGATGSAGGTGAHTRAGIEALANGWYRCWVVGTLGGGITAAQARIYISEGDLDLTFNGDGASYISVWGAQLEDSSAFPTSYIATTTATVTRAVDVLSYPIPSGMTTPAASTFYLKFVERGTSLITSARLLQLSESGAFANCLQVSSTGAGLYNVSLRDSGAVVTSSSTTGAATTIGDTVELLITVSSTGVVQISQALNGGSFTTAAAGAAGGLPAQWGTGTAKMFIGCTSAAGANAGAVALQSIRIASGSQTTSYMQSIVYDSGWLNQYPSGHTAETLEGMNIPHVVVIPTTQTAFRYCSVQIDDTANSASYVDLGRLVIAAGWQPTVNFSTGADFGLEDGTIREDTDGFSAVFTEKNRRRTARFRLAAMEQSEAWGSGFDFQRRAGIAGQFFWIFDPGDTTHLHRRAFLATMRRLTALEYPYPTYMGMAFELVEEL